MSIVTSRLADKDHLKVFANQDAAETWVQENDPEGVAFEYEVMDSALRIIEKFDRQLIRSAAALTFHLPPSVP